MRTLVLGTAGHIDHGKTALVRALTGVDTDRLPEEKRRGITIDLGFARLALDDGVVLGIVDVPGHENFIRNMLAGATGIDLALLVIAADEGVMPQTREHAAILDLLGVRNGVVAITKNDLVDAEWLDLVMDDARALLQHGGLANAALVPVSARSGAGLDELRAALLASSRHAANRVEHDLLRLPVDRSFSIRGTGTVVTGTMWSGRVRDGDHVMVMPAGERYRVRGVQVHGEARSSASSGERTAVALAGAERADIPRGSLLVTGDGWSPASIMTVRLRLLPGAQPLRTRHRVRFHLATTERMGRIVLLDRAELTPGESGWAQIRLEEPVVARAGDRFVLRSYSPVTTIGGGTVHEPAAARRKRLRESDAHVIDALVSVRPEVALGALLQLHGWAGVPLARLPVQAAVPTAEVNSALEAISAQRIGERFIAPDILQLARQSLCDAIDSYHAAWPLQEGIDRDELRRALPPDAAPGLADFTLNALIGDGMVRTASSRVARAGFTPVATAAQLVATDAIVHAITAAGLEAPNFDELPASLRADPDTLDLIHFAARQGRLVMLPDARMMATPVLMDVIARVRGAFDEGAELATAELKGILPISRKYLIPLLEHLDRTGITQREGQTRRLVRIR
jgi:selenocysteine-specific elongation factor